MKLNENRNVMDAKFKTTLFILLSMILFELNLNSQVIQGIVIDKVTRTPIPYVNIGIYQASHGTVSNGKGEFTLNVKETNYTDSIGFSSIGYQTCNMNLENILNHNSNNDIVVLLTPITYSIAEVKVKPVNVRYKTVGNGSGDKRKKAGFGNNDILGREMGTIIRSGNSLAYVEKAIINIGINSYGRIKLRLNLYSLKNQLPDEKINAEPIYFETEIKNGECIVDLTKYNISVSSDFFISIEYIEDMGEYGLYFSFSFDKASSFYRETSLSPWIEIVYEERIISLGINTVLGYPVKKRPH